MLRVNGTDINLLDKDNVYVKHYNECMARLKEVVTGDKKAKDLSVTLVYSSDFQLKNAHGITTYAQQLNPRLNADIIRKGVREKWIYYTDITRDQNNREIFLPKYFPLRYSKTFTGDNADWQLAFFLIFISPSCEKIQGLTDLQNNSANSIKLFKIQNINADDVRVQTINLKKANIIHSVYNMSPETLKDVAVNDYGLYFVNDIKTREALVNKIFSDDNLVLSYNEENYKEEVITIRRLFNFAYDKNLIGFDEGTKSWRWKKETGGWDSVIIKTQPLIHNTIEEKKKVIMEELKANIELIEKLEQIKSKYDTLERIK